ncbi:hypothetical protein RD792_010350 [Penstemon davidsonii]|uniref:Non-specific serine/threonine protein kinase n=1 Tax=Penstemon davidsonii TaxID=160366 RepID=A0ABR0D1T9_9LAMI|nr:hypothetical protein RD792_010350 [Penstemon davidsonii]
MLRPARPYRSDSQMENLRTPNTHGASQLEPKDDFFCEKSESGGGEGRRWSKNEAPAPSIETRVALYKGYSKTKIRKYDRALVVAVDGTIYYVDTRTGKIKWSFCSTPSVHSSLHLPQREDDTKVFYIDCEEDWELSVHGIDLKKVICLQDGRSLASRLQSAFPGDRVISLSSPRHNIMYDAKKNVLHFHSGYEEKKMLALPASSGNLVEYQNSARSIYITVATLFLGVVVCFLAFWWFKKRRSKANLSNDVGSEQIHGRDGVTSSSTNLPNDVGSEQKVEWGTGVTDSSTKVSNDVDNYESKHKLGKLVISEEIIGMGSDGTVVFEGNLDKRLVAVKRMNKTHIKLAEKQMAHLLKSDNHPNIVRYYGIDEDRDFVYLILERCTCSLSDLVKVYVSNIQGPQVQRNEQLLEIFGTKGEFRLLENNGHPSALFLKLMRDIVFGLSYLHNEKRIVHRDLKPQNILVTKNGTLVFAKISDMGISKALDEGKSSLPKNATGNGTFGWRAPELIDRKKRQTPAVDLFSLGCILFYCITGGKHPFGKSYVDRERNIVADQKDLKMINNLPEAKDLIFQLLNLDPELRPTAAKVLKHPFFWDAEKRVSFLCAVSDHINLGPRNASCLTPELEKINNLVFGTEWKTKLDSDIIRDLNNLNIRYRYDSVSELLRLIRNLSHHCKDYSRSTKTVLGSGTPEGILKYFSTCFPELLMGVYKTVLSHSANEQEFEKFFE